MGAQIVTHVSPSRFFYGWWVTLACAVGLFVGPIPISIFCFGVFLRPFVRDFHAGRGAISLCTTLTTGMVALSLPVAGALIDRLGPRKVMLFCTVLSGLILLAINFSTARLWQLYLFYSALGLATCGISPVSYGHVVTHWFDRYRGLALGLMMFGLGLGALVMPPIAQYLITTVGWRNAFAAIGTGMFLITFPVLVIFLKNSPDDIRLLPDGSTDPSCLSCAVYSDSGLPWGEALRDRTFWLLFWAFVLVSASVQACLAHVASILADRGAAAQTAALATSLFGGGVLIGRTATGYLLDRFFAPRVAALIFGCAGAGIALLAIAGSQQLAFLAAFFIGLGMGAEVDIMAYLTSRYFGLRSFGAIYGITFAGFALAGGLGAFLMGAAFDASGSYKSMLAFFCISTFIGAALMLCLKAYRYGVRTVDV